MPLKLPSDVDRRRSAASRPPEWTGDLSDDCTAVWAGFLLRAEQMDVDDWWWCVYDGDGRADPVAASNYERRRCTTGEAARAAAERAAKRFLGLRTDP